ncbi:ATP-grasp domain-containing protein [Ancylobacter amanitiformis]|uniref:Biotin carboxylase n=1 Tax=Ancylobacter amanitiformis TaxID=217069 RepID=A0ABU0LWL9_9HYPH|nr:hypothetical protein [Ancylobacter amanitiformis]MDQ0513084.1 biotin carboxylase [Ancylobacter amanitiformis]
MSKTILFLGASPQQLAPIDYARAAGYRTVTCDNRPGNPGHRLAHASYNVSTTAMDEVLRVAERERIDAVVSFGSDVGAPTAAFVAERLGLPGNPLDGVRTLTDKGRFRALQAECGRFHPRHLTLAAGDLSDPRRVQERVRAEVGTKVIVKPVDASGAKGVRKIADPAELLPAIRAAIGFSASGRAIVETVIDQLGYQICGEGFLRDGRIAFHAFANEHFHPGIHVPVGESFPSVFDPRLIGKAVDELQFLFGQTGLRQGPFNFDLIFTPEGEVFVIEIGPRNGGNRMPEAILYGTGVDTIAATVEIALGRPVDLARRHDYLCSTYSVYSDAPGILQAVLYDPHVRRRIVDERLFLGPGDPVERFEMGSLMIGNLILTFDTYVDMIETIDRMKDHITVSLV